MGLFEIASQSAANDTTATVYRNELDHDVFRAKYYPLPGRSGEFVHVSHYDSISGKFSGTFEFTVFLGNNDGIENYPDSLVITDGYFDTYFVK